MSSSQILALGAVAGLTIFIGLPLGRLDNPDVRLKVALSGMATGILLFLLYDVFAHGIAPVEESLDAADPDFELWDIGHAALDAAASHLNIATTDLLYARVDVIGGPDNPLLLELELVEPSLGWRQLERTTRDLQQRKFAIGVESALDRLGLGPLPH